MTDYDVIVCGAGILGLSATRALSKQGLKTICLDRHIPPHSHGSSSGESRLFRTAYFEDARYIPLLKRADILWRALEKECGNKILQRNGFLLASPGSHVQLNSVSQHAHSFDIALERLTSRAVAKHYPQLRIPALWEATLELNAGIIYPELAVKTFLALAIKAGATIHGNEPIMRIELSDSYVDVTTERARYRAQHLVFALGSYTNHFAALIPMPITVTRALQFWFPCSSSFNVNTTPCFAFADHNEFIYGFPAVSPRGTKLARYQGYEVVASPLVANPSFSCSELAPIEHAVKNYLPMVQPTVAHHHVCFYASTNDENFLIDRHAQFPRVIFACGDSGHAFKFAPVIGELVTSLITDRQCEYDAGFLRVR